MPQTLEERVALIEEELKQLRQLTQSSPTPKHKGWRSLLGTSDDDPAFDEIIRLGREYRNGQIPNYEETQS
ncbi:hypothetical protein [Armatimonas sp.]|uniref:hypothetical protein n=1 Tax=Armatimonas sp. TaxID=1872638 RepID=UPI003751AF28